MLTTSSMRAALCIIMVCSSSACVTLPPNSKPVPQDPWESWNRGVYKFNDVLDRAFAKPVAKTYVRFVPHPIRTGVSNFFDNLSTTTVMINDALQGKFKASANDLGRFLLNSTVGLAGLLDPATSAGLDKNNEDFGQTLGHWGVHPGPFFELPVLGPSDVRDAPARLVDAYTNPHAYIRNTYWKWGLYGAYLVDARANLLSLDDTVQRVYDPYAFVRDAYLQRRAYLVSDGKVKDEEPLVDPDADNPDQGAPAKPGPEAAPTPPQPQPQPASPPATAPSGKPGTGDPQAASD
jgi:phospholipid-binding lipoprotein MlaA